MGNVFGVSGAADDAAPAAPTGDLIASLTTFVRLHRQHGDRIGRTARGLAEVSAGLGQSSREAVTVFTVLGGAVGGACGGGAGGVLGAFGGVSAATYGRLLGGANAVDASLGLLGSLLGGVVGGATGGAVGSAVGAAGESRRDSVCTAVSDAAAFAIGGTAGGALGDTFGGRIGAVGGAFGGGVGALLTARFANLLVGGVFSRLYGSNEAWEEKMMSAKQLSVQRTGDFRDAIKPLVDQLKTITAISDRAAPGGTVAALTARTLASVRAMDRTVSACERAANLPRLAAAIRLCARHGETVRGELQAASTELQAAATELQAVLDSPRDP